MSVIAHLRVPSHDFELGRILEVDRDASLELEKLIPLGERAVPFFLVEDGDSKEFRERVEDHPMVAGLHLVVEHENTNLYALDWDVSRDLFFQGLVDVDAHLLDAKAAAGSWAFEVRFSNYDRLREFEEYCSNAHISIDVRRIYNPTPPEAGMWYGLSEPQRNALVRAVQGGYYSIPRRMSTKDLAGELGISDQAVTERLRRGIITLVENTLIVELEQDDGSDGWLEK